jgi:hypothetical protein
MGNVALVAILGTSILLRFFRIPENLVFHGELGANYLAIKNFILSGQIPLLGPPTSHPWLSFGPLYYWIFPPVLALFKYNPLAGSYFFATVGVLIVILNYFVVGKLFDKRVALISSFLLAISPAWLSLAREARFFSLVTLFFYPFLYFFVKAVQRKGKGLFWAGFFFGTMLNFHLSPLILVPPIILIIYWNRKNLARNELFKGIGGLIIPNIPFLLYNLQHRFEMLGSVLIWIPYRILGFLGFYPKNTISVNIAGENIVSFYRFFSSNLIVMDNTVAILLFVLVLGFIAIKKGRTIAETTLVLFLILGYLGIFIHGNPPFHYYLPLYPIPAIFTGIVFSRLAFRKWGSILVAILLFYITFANLRFYLSDKWFYLYNPLSYAQQKKASEFIVEDANGTKYMLKRIGENDSFEGNYAQNYQYLLWWLGNEPVEKATLRYTIIEDPNLGIEVKKEKL